MKPRDGSSAACHNARPWSASAWARAVAQVALAAALLVLAAPMALASTTTVDHVDLHNDTGASGGAAMEHMGELQSGNPTTYPARLETGFGPQQLNVSRTLGAGGEECGSQVAAGDVNGDGLEDVLLGCRNATVAAQASAGTAELFLRNASNDGYTSAGEFAAAVPGAAEQCGAGVAMGDLNGDGNADLVVGCWLAAVGADVGAGYIRVFLRNAANTGFDPGVDISAATPAAGEHCGGQVATADVNGDGRDDIVAGCPDYDPGGTPGAGRGHVFVRNAANTGFEPSVEVLRAVPEAADQCGVSVSAGDLNGDGNADVVVGCEAASPGAIANAGLVTVFVRNAANTGFAAGTELVADTPELFESCGHSTAVADVNTDGNGDIIAGCYFATVGGNVAAGRVVIFERNVANTGFAGSSTVSDAGWSALALCGTSLTTADLGGDDGVDLLIGCSSSNPGAINGAGSVEAWVGDGSGAFTADLQLSDAGADLFDQCGSALAAGDVDGDGRDDVLTGCLAGDGGAADSGTVETFTWHNSYATANPAPVAADRCGDAVASGDLDGDGISDLVVGCPDGEGAPAVASGVAHAMLADPEGRSMDAGSTAAIAPATTAGDDCGTAVAVGDVNGDGLDDVAVGCPGADNGAGASSGVVAVQTSSSSAGSASFSAVANLVHPAPAAGDSCGSSVALEDVNYDGNADVVMGCSGDSVSSQAGAGSAVVFLRDVGNGGFQSGSVVAASSPEAGAACGSAVAAGDVNGDHRKDLIIGCPAADPSSSVDAGAVLVATRASSNNGFNAPTVITRGALTAGEECGAGVAAADVNDDGRDDLVVGCPLATVGATPTAGEVVVYARNIANSGFSAGVAVEPGAAVSGDECGRSVAVADLNMDGRDDLAMGCPGADPNASAGAGKAVTATRDSGNTGFDLSQEVWEGLATSPGDACGTALATGDSNGDGRPDVLGGCPGAAGGGEAHTYVSHTQGNFASGQVLTTGPLNRTPGGIGSAQVDWVARNNTESLSIEVSGNGGTTWRPATNGATIQTPEWGSVLQVRVTFTGDRATRTALLTDLTVTYSTPQYPDTTKPTIVELDSALKFFSRSRRQLRFLIEDPDPGPGIVSGIGSVRAYYRSRRIPYSRSKGVDTRRLPEGRGWLKVIATDRAGNSRQRALHLSIDRTAPKIKGKRVKHIIGGFAYFDLKDNVSGSRFGRKRIWARQPGRNVHRIRITDRAGNRAHRTAYTYRHISLSQTWYNDDFRYRGGGTTFGATQQNLDFVFAFRFATPPWYQQTHMTGAFLREIQWRLTFLGYLPPMYRGGGVWDMPTINALKAFQADEGIPAIATVGPSTRQALDAALWRRIGKSV